MYEARLPPRRRLHGAAAAVVAVVAVLLPVLAVVLVLVLTAGTTTKPARRGLLESIFQDDDHLIYAPAGTVARTLDTLRGLGVDRIRLTILWRAIAPAPNAPVPPAGFAAANPGAYPQSAWLPYDRVVELAAARGIRVAFNLTAPGPLWAMTQPAPSAKLADHFAPSATAFGQFVTAVARRYSGSTPAPATVLAESGSPPPSSGAGSARLPRVSYWTIWNEPNQPGWLAPQWQMFDGHDVPASPALYRGYVDAAFRALQQTGHGPGRDTILIGEMAPEGSETAATESPIPAMRFLRFLYCVGDDYRPLTGTVAVAVGCPVSGGPGAFRKAHPGLFVATGFAHHPYSFFLAPGISLQDPNFAPLADLGRLEHGLDRALRAYGVNRQLPLYLTEYGYETNPPDPFRGVSEKLQSLYLNQAQYLAARDPRVRAMAQFLLFDARPNRLFRPGSIGYWSTFQTGLMFANGQPKLSLNSYRLPIFVPDPAVRPGQKLEVWAMLRLAPNGLREQALVQWRPVHGPYRTLAKVLTSDPSGFVTARVSVPGPGAVRVGWISPTGLLWHSRSVGVQ